jgi:hypothetical protein
VIVEGDRPSAPDVTESFRYLPGPVPWDPHAGYQAWDVELFHDLVDGSSVGGMTCVTPKCTGAGTDSCRPVVSVDQCCTRRAEEAEGQNEAEEQ